NYMNKNDGKRYYNIATFHLFSRGEGLFCAQATQNYALSMRVSNERAVAAARRMFVKFCNVRKN
ncbi:MAG: hypothetical protein SOY07_10245, partial [Bacteroidales bacterium]|nr:hypothetical protein [Bacteroidales bacterium]